MKYRVISSFTLIFFLSLWHISAQNNQDIKVKIGGPHQKESLHQKATEKTKLDEAQLSILYQFKHGIVNNKNISFVIDTMILVVGPQFSIYFDRNEKIGREAFSSYFHDDGQDGPLKVFASTPYDKFTEIAIDDNKLFTPSISGETSQLYKDRKKNFVTVMDFDNSNFEDEIFFFYEEEMSPINWEIKGDTTSVLGYTCRKATCDFEGRSYSAWFTQDIPINDGPYKFYGLPGMILKIEDSENFFQFVAIGLEKMENAEIVIDDKSKYEKCTKEEYKKLKKRLQENFTVFYRSGVVLYYCNQKKGIEYIPIEKEVNRK